MIMAIRLGAFIGIIFLSLYTHSGYTQSSDTLRRAKIAICMPLYIDSAFNGNAYKWSKSNIPSYAAKGLEFYNGVQAAIDSLGAQGIVANVFILDTKTKDGLDKQLNNPLFEDVDVLIGNLTSVNELQVLSKIAYKKNIPFISATYPNDGNITANPFMTILNTTLQTHIAGICDYLQKYYVSSNIIFCTRKGSVEDMLWNYVEQANSSSTEPLSIQKIFLEDSASLNHITSYLKKDKTNICIAGSLNESFGISLAKQLASTTDNYPVTLLGMPNWDGIKILSNSAYKNLTIVYTSPFNYTNSNTAVSIFRSTYKKKYQSVPSDMLLKGFECMYRFGKLVATAVKQGESLNIADSRFKVFNDFDIQPVEHKKNKVDYFENKKIYFVQQQNGQLKVIE